MAGRLLALIISLAALIGIGVEWANLMQRGAGPAQALWALLLYFTIMTNALVLLVFGRIAWRGDDAVHPRWLAGMLAAIMLVGAIAALLLQGLRDLTGATALGDFLLHRFTPVTAALYWLIFARKGALSFRDPFWWALYPLAYLPYALARGLAEGRFPYPFINVAALGWGQVALNAVMIAACFVAAGELLVLIDRRLARSAKGAPAIR